MPMRIEVLASQGAIHLVRISEEDKPYYLVVNRDRNEEIEFPDLANARDYYFELIKKDE